MNEDELGRFNLFHSSLLTLYYFIKFIILIWFCIHKYLCLYASYIYSIISYGIHQKYSHIGRCNRFACSHTESQINVCVCVCGDLAVDDWNVLAIRTKPKTFICLLCKWKLKFLLFALCLMINTKIVKFMFCEWRTKEKRSRFVWWNLNLNATRDFRHLFSR